MSFFYDKSKNNKPDSADKNQVYYDMVKKALEKSDLISAENLEKCDIKLLVSVIRKYFKNL